MSRRRGGRARLPGGTLTASDRSSALAQLLAAAPSTIRASLSPVAHPLADPHSVVSFPTAGESGRSASSRHPMHEGARHRPTFGDRAPAQRLFRADAANRSDIAASRLAGVAPLASGVYS